ncbi:MAG: carbohydrate kinase family protein [Dehalococcoidia bacterium]|nr:carbohydrate kinase family protein [Dehalococcoidia bacterium]
MIDVLIVGGIFREILDGDSKPRRRYGGSGLTASIAASRFGARVALASYVGEEDAAGVRAELLAARVNDVHVVTVSGASGTFVFPTCENPERPWPMYRPAEAVPSALSQSLPVANIVVLFGIPDFDPVTFGWVTDLGPDVTLIWDRQGWLSRARNTEGVLGLAPSRKIYLANEKEAMEDASASTLDEVLAFQPPSGFVAAVVKRGVRGVVVIERSEGGTCTNIVDSFPVQTESTIGAGDVFAGAFAARLSRGDSPRNAARWGCAASAVALAAGSNLLDDNALPEAESLMLSNTGHTPES